MFVLAVGMLVSSYRKFGIGSIDIGGFVMCRWVSDFARKIRGLESARCRALRSRVLRDAWDSESVGQVKWLRKRWVESVWLP